MLLWYSSRTTQQHFELVVTCHGEGSTGREKQHSQQGTPEQAPYTILHVQFTQYVKQASISGFLSNNGSCTRSGSGDRPLNLKSTKKGRIEIKRVR